MDINIQITYNNILYYTFPVRKASLYIEFLCHICSRDLTQQQWSLRNLVFWWQNIVYCNNSVLFIWDSCLKLKKKKKRAKDTFKILTEAAWGGGYLSIRWGSVLCCIHRMGSQGPSSPTPEPTWFPHVPPLQVAMFIAGDSLPRTWQLPILFKSPSPQRRSLNNALSTLLEFPLKIKRSFPCHHSWLSFALK